MSNDQEEYIATLIHPDEYAHQLNQVLGLTTQNISLLTRGSKSPHKFEITKYPIGECITVIYRQERSIMKIIMGCLLILLLGLILYMVLSFWDHLEPRTRIPVGLLMLAGIYGIRWIHESKRHRFVFLLKDGSKLTWKSRSGDFVSKNASTRKIIEYTKSVGLLVTEN
jgi:hypothetical protein